MAGGNKKKKKPAANPARGFATTSIVSKARPEGNSSDLSSTTATGPTSQATTNAGTPDNRQDKIQSRTESKELKDLSPDELEARLEESELQQFVDQNAAKVRRDASRQVARLETERRLLRPQAESTFLGSWIQQNDPLFLSLIDSDTAQTEHGKSESRKILTNDALLQRLWTLKAVLEGLHLANEQISHSLQHVLSIPTVEETSTMVWGLTESLEWTAQRPGTQCLEDYDTDTVLKHAIGDEIDPAIVRRIEDAGKVAQPSRAAKVSKQDPKPAQAPQELLSDLLVSDTDSDLEPDEMLSKHLSYRLKLVEHRPEKYGNEGAKFNANATNLVLSTGEGRLLRRINKFEMDPLFDKDAADATWREKRVQAFRELSERRKLGVSEPPTIRAPNRGRESSDVASQAMEAAEAIAADILASGESDEDGLFEGIFDAPDTADNDPQEKTTGDSADLITRDFGKLTGMSPRRVLEEACKARDPGARLVLKMISPTTYHCRHSALIRWSKDQEPLTTAGLEGIEVHSTTRAVLVEPVRLAAVGAEQSEGLVCTAALFAIFSGSSKEDKAALRLPQSFRDLYNEFVVNKQETSDAADRITVKELRGLIEQEQQEREDEDVVLSKAFRDRSRKTTRDNSPNGIIRQPAETNGVDQNLISFWNQRSNEAAFQKMLHGRKELPMFRFKQEALEVVRQNQVTILCGETGCGKSTQMPSFILEDELSQGKSCRIYCTEPRRISAISLANRVSEELGEGKNAVGTARSLVGYAIRLESQTSNSTRLVYATVGIVLRMLESDNGLRDLTHLIIDEVHERSIDTDFLLIVLRSLMEKRPDLKVILMSATVDAERFSKYLGNAPVINVPGRTFPVQAMYLEDAVEMTGYRVESDGLKRDDEDDDEIDTDQLSGSINSDELVNYSKSTIKTLAAFDEYRIDYNLIILLLAQVANSPKLRLFSKAILVFLPGIAEIRQLNDMLTGHPTFANGWLIYPLHSSFSSDDQQAAFQVPRKGLRKIVLATNIAETGITIPDVTCVVDTGKHKEMRFDERRQLSRLIQSFISRANAKQRRGRAGRVQEGICFHLFTKHRHDKMMAEQQTPEMLRLSLQDLVMRVKICKLGDIRTALASALDPPSARNIGRAIDALVEVGALTSSEELTALGQQLARLPLDAQLGKLLLLGSVFNCLDFVLTSAAVASSKTPFLSPMNARRQADTVRLGFKRGDSDLLTTYNAYCTWRKVCHSSGISEFEFCKRNFLSPQNLSNIEELKAQLLSSLAEAGIVSLTSDERSALSRLRSSRHQKSFVAVPQQKNVNEANDTLISAVLAWSFYPKVLRREGKGWRSVANNQTLSLHPTSVNKLSPSPSFERTQYLSFYSIMQSSSRFTNAQETTPVEPLALILLAGDAKFDLYAGVVSIDGNRLRFKVRNGKELLMLKCLRARARELVGKEWKRPRRELSDKDKKWFGLLMEMFARFEQGRRAKEAAR